MWDKKKTTIIIANYVGWGSELFNRMLLFPSVTMVPLDIAATFTELSFEGELFDDLVVLAIGTFDIVNNPTMSLIVWYSMFFTCGDHVMSCEQNIEIDILCKRSKILTVLATVVLWLCTIPVCFSTF